ncbi:MAG: cytochrome c [Leptospiraceae bacterium]
MIRDLFDRSAYWKGWPLWPAAVFGLSLYCSDPLSDPAVQEFRTQVATEHQPGFDAYIEHNCQACHGLNGSGGGPLNASGRFSIPDFTDPSSYRQGFTASEIRNSIEFGVEGGRTGMQAYQNIPPQQLDDISRYIQWLQKQ